MPPPASCGPRDKATRRHDIDWPWPRARRLARRPARRRATASSLATRCLPREDAVNERRKRKCGQASAKSTQQRERPVARRRRVSLSDRVWTGGCKHPTSRTTPAQVGSALIRWFVAGGLAPPARRNCLRMERLQAGGWPTGQTTLEVPRCQTL